MKSPVLLPRLFVVGSLCGILASSHVSAADLYWDGSNNNLWSSTANWSLSPSGGGTGTVPGAADNAIFAATGAGNLSNISTDGAARAMNSLTFNSSIASPVGINIDNPSVAARTFRIATDLTVQSGVTGNVTISGPADGNDYLLWGSTPAASGTYDNNITNNSTSSLLTISALQRHSTTISFTVVNNLNYGGAGNILVSGKIEAASPTNRTLNLIKAGTGTLTLSNGANDYNGSTTISGGTLLLSGAGKMGTGNVEMNGGVLDISGISGSSYGLTASQSLTGAGTINATGKTLSVAGMLAPGSNGPGALTVDGGFTLENTAVANFQINGAGVGLFDRLDVNGLLTLDGTLNLATGFAAVEGQFVDLFDWDTLAGQFDLITGTDLGGGLSWDTSALYSTGIITVVPEPATVQVLLLSAGLMAFVFIRRRRRALA